MQYLLFARVVANVYEDRAFVYYMEHGEVRGSC